MLIFPKRICHGLIWTSTDGAVNELLAVLSEDIEKGKRFRERRL